MTNHVQKAEPDVATRCQSAPSVTLPSPCVSLFALTRLSAVLLLLIAPRSTLSCYAYPPDMTDPCEGKQCSFGAQCVPSLDGQTARCQCPEQCSHYGDSVGSRPVCGSDGRDYRNVCELKRAACHAMEDVTVKYEEKCGELTFYETIMGQLGKLTTGY